MHSPLRHRDILWANYAAVIQRTTHNRVPTSREGDQENRMHQVSCAGMSLSSGMTSRRSDEMIFLWLARRSDSILTGPVALERLGWNKLDSPVGVFVVTAAFWLRFVLVVPPTDTPRLSLIAFLEPTLFDENYIRRKDRNEKLGRSLSLSEKVLFRHNC